MADCDEGILQFVREKGVSRMKPRRDLGVTQKTA